MKFNLKCKLGFHTYLKMKPIRAQITSLVKKGKFKGCVKLTGKIIMVYMMCVDCGKRKIINRVKITNKVNL